MSATAERLVSGTIVRRMWAVLAALLRAMYAFSFALPLFNPAVGDTTLYFYIWLPLWDLEFLHSVATRKFDLHRFNSVAFAGLLFLLAVHSWELCLRAVLIAIQVAYLFFLVKRHLLRYLALSLVAHVLVAVLQVTFLVGAGSVPTYLTPTGITAALWGPSFAPASFSNFGYELFLPRVSGLHREAGFFSAYVISLYLVFSATPDLRARRLLYWLVAAGVLLSFSKISVVVLLILLVKWQYRFIDRIPLWITLACAVIVSMFVAREVFDFIGDDPVLSVEGNSISLMHRFFSYYVGQHLDIVNLLFGIYTPVSTHLGTQLQGFMDNLYATVGGLREYNLYVGVGGLLVRGGLVAMAAFLLLLRRLGVRSSEFLVLFLATFAVGLDTLQNFVILVWFYVGLQTLRKRAEELPSLVPAA